MKNGLAWGIVGLGLSAFCFLLRWLIVRADRLKRAGKEKEAYAQSLKTMAADQAGLAEPHKNHLFDIELGLDDLAASEMLSGGPVRKKVSSRTVAKNGASRSKNVRRH